MQKWQYTIRFRTRSADTEFFNFDFNNLQEMGQEGWELVSVVRHNDCYHEYYFKRPYDEELIESDRQKLLGLMQEAGATPQNRVYPIDKSGAHRTGTLTNITKADIEAVLGFAPNIKDDPYKVKYSWGFTVDGKECGIWDYKGSYRFREYSTYGPDEVFVELFGDKYGG